MGKMTRDEFVSRLEKLDKDIDWDKAYKFFERQTGKRTETSKEVLRNSWVFDVVFHIYHGVGTSKITKSFLLIRWAAAPFIQIQPEPLAPFIT